MLRARAATTRGRTSPSAPAAADEGAPDGAGQAGRAADGVSDFTFDDSIFATPEAAPATWHPGGADAGQPCPDPAPADAGQATPAARPARRLPLRLALAGVAAIALGLLLLGVRHGDLRLGQLASLVPGQRAADATAVRGPVPPAPPAAARPVAAPAVTPAPPVKPASSVKPAPPMTAAAPEKAVTPAARRAGPAVAPKPSPVAMRATPVAAVKPVSAVKPAAAGQAKPAGSGWEEAQFTLAGEYRQAGDADSAMQVYHRLFRESRQKARAAFELGDLLLERERYQEAQDMYALSKELQDAASRPRVSRK
jgi:tetratricopeptide (TPR) repeat protein